MKISCTLFDSIFDNKTSKQITYNSFDEFVQVLHVLSKSTKYPTKKSAPLISPAVYKPGTTRANDNVEYWGGFGIVDVDDYTGSIEDIHKKYSQYRYVCYSTASSTTEYPKFRLVFPLTQNVQRDNIKHFWYALNKEIGDIADVQTKDMSRMYYVPQTYRDAYNFFFVHDGDIMDPVVLMDKHKYVERSGNTFFDKLPKSMQMAMMEHRKNQLTNTNYTWSGYSDCPFINKKQVDDYKAITNSGWYHQMYKIMVTTAANAVAKGYPITAKDIEWICRDLDSDTGFWYKKRDMAKEAERAIDFVFKNSL